MTATSQPAQNVTLGALLITLAFACVATMSAFGKEAARLPTATIVFFQNSISLMLFAPWFLSKGIAELRTGRLTFHIMRAAGGLLSQALMFIAVKKLPLVNAVLLSNSAPLFIPVVAWIWLRQTITAMVWISLLIGFAGVILILRPGPELFANPVALLAMTAAICSAFALVTVNQLSKTEPARRILFYYFLVSSLAAAPFVLSSWKTPTTREWLILLGIGITMAASQMLIILAYQRASSTVIAPFNYSVIIFSGLIGWIVWHNTPDLLALAGVILVTCGGVLSTKFSGPHTSGHHGWLGFWNHQPA